MAVRKATWKKTGEWNKVLRISRNMEATIRRSLPQTMMKVTLKAERMAVKFMSDQNLPWEKLSTQYLNRKARQGLSNKILIATSSYFQSITSKVEGFDGYTGVFKQVKNKEGQEVADIAMIHEYGSIKRNIPPRRLWSVVLNDVHDWLAKTKPFAIDAINQIRNS